MSGICGIYNIQKQESVLSREIKQMLTAQHHRGTGEIGLYLYKNIGIGFQPEKSGMLHQPVASADESVWAVFDGNIYNYLKLRNLPQMKKYLFFSNSPAELLINLYLEYNEACVELLRGAFVFAIWVKAEKKLFLARDPLGLRQLYYAEFDGRIFFASDLKALLQDTRIPRNLDARAVNQFLHNGFVLAPDTILSRVKKIGAGHAVSFSPGGSQVKHYWEYQPNVRENAGSDELQTRLQRVLEAAVSAAVPKASPVGVLLSGGLDSGLLLALLRRCCTNELVTFHLRTDSEMADPSAQQAQLLSQRFDTRHFELVVSPHDFLHHFARALWYQDEPVADPAMVAQFQLNQFVKLNLNTVLSAQGLDELFGGKEEYLKISRIFQMNDFVLAENHGNGGSRCRRLPRVRHRSRKMPAKNGAFPVPEQILFDEQQVYSSQFWLKLKSEGGIPVNGRKVPSAQLDKLLYFEINDFLPERALPKNNRFSAAISPDIRLPFLNPVLVALSTRIPANLKINQMHTKYILRVLAQQFLPESVVWQRRRGWQVPLEVWFQGPLKFWPSEVLLTRQHFERGLFNPERLRQLISDQVAGETATSRLIYALLCLETWLTLFLDEMPAEADERMLHTAFT